MTCNDLLNVIVGTVLGVTVGQIIKTVKSVTKVFVLIFGGMGLIIGLVSFSAFMDLGNPGPNYVDFAMLDFVIGITLSLIGSIPIYYFWFRKEQKNERHQNEEPLTLVRGCEKVLIVKIILTLIFIFSSNLLQAKSPNVVILFTDDQGTIDANCYGSKDLITPNIDRLAETGVLFTQAYAHTVCCPARAALMTGRHPQRGGVWNWTQGDMNSAKGINMALEEVTLAEALKPSGYRSALFGKWHLGAHRDYGPKKQGFDEFFGIRDGFIDNYNHYFLHGTGFHDLYEGTTAVKAEGQYFPELMVKRSLNFIDENKDNPFLLYVPFNIPHYPEQALKMHESLYKEMKDPARRSYGAIVTTTDYYIGQIIDRIEKHGLRDDTIIIFMSDNGHSEETGNKIRVENHKSGYNKNHFYGASGGGSTGKWIGQKGNFLEGGVRVPAIISYPSKLPKGTVRDQTITAMDWFPTLIELCDVKPNPSSPPLDGHNILPLIKDKKAKSKHTKLHFSWGNNWAVRSGEWKLIGNKDNPQSLHKLNDEKPEVKNYAKENPKKVQQLLTLHRAWAKEVSPKKK